MPEALIVPLVRYRILHQHDDGIDGDDLRRGEAAGQKFGRVISQEKCSSVEDVGIGAVSGIDAEGDIVEAEAFEDRKVCLADGDFAAEEFGEIGAGHRSDALGVREIDVAEDDDGKEEEDGSHSGGGGRRNGCAQGMPGAPAFLEETLRIRQHIHRFITTTCPAKRNAPGGQNSHRRFSRDSIAERSDR